ncbi:hypothetical protein DM02DRAFT_121069 [Periconia macrospinosa]|uniref:Nuclear segregation protein Bfr1 n=1 Tax=Periconia macrospinosa TaxID=97972 RepID=A0A2V1DE96_9PLEO|nr:hypothetical protein DM02DRAFT_121069 [Periconia macrospinosa]
MKLVDEKKALGDISSLNKARKNFSGFDAQQKAIDDLKAQYTEQKKLLDDPEQKAISQKYNELQSELDALKKEQDEAFTNLRGLREATDKARAEQQEKWQSLKDFKDNYYQQKRAFADYDYQARKARQERKRQEQLEWQANKRKETAAKRLEEASAPAYQDEILACEGLIRHFDPSALPAKETTATNKFAASAQRTVESSGFKGTRIVKKDDLKEKLAHWKSDQDRKTKENIAKAQKEIDRLEAEETDGATDTARKPSQKNQAVNGGAVSAGAELEQEKDAEADVAEELKKAKIEDGEA